MTIYATLIDGIPAGLTREQVAELLLGGVTIRIHGTEYRLKLNAVEVVTKALDR
jgi:hypothetical protein